ncbi:G-protein coupled receptor moody-like [Patiria miniata]|uniref:G-protein coupled receptors family 1 profile domain-containing protein n=1 Tax=Patiria miniata TaxID=46514 RepID=A0A913Z068_PATMI|nr:G-protein coupled receptor moody-like [Patiria miniata]
MENSTDIPPFEFSDMIQRTIVASLILIISLVGIIGNSLVILAVLLSKKLRTTTNAFVVNLSIADLLTCLVIPWDAVALLGKDGLPVGEWICSIVAAVIFTTVGCSICTLASIATNRLLLITRPTATYRRIYTPKKIAVWLVVIWLVPLLTTTIPPLLNVGALGFNQQFHFCGSIHTHPNYNAFNLIISAVLYPIPCFVIVVSYSLIWIHLHRQAKKLTKRPVSSSPISVSAIANNQDAIPMDQLPVPAATSNANRSPGTSRQTEVTKNMLYVVCGFGLCTTPYSVNLFADDNSPLIPYTTVIVLLNSCINPLIYATKHRDFKTVFGCILRRRWVLIPNPSNFLKALTR